MRCLCNASVVIYLFNGFNKKPIIDANIICSGYNASCIRKKNGIYVLLNMKSGRYKLNVSCYGYIEKSYDIEVKDGNTYEINDSLFWNIDYKKNSDCKVIQLKNNDKILSNRQIKLSVADVLPFLRVIGVNQEDQCLLKLSGEYNNEFIKQEYAYSNDSYLYIDTYREETEEFVSINKIENTSEGCFLRPIWNITTDSCGQIIIPVKNSFFRKSTVKFLIEADNKKIEALINMHDNNIYSVNF